MGFYKLPTDIRMLIYVELLVAVVPIQFVTDDGPDSPALLREQQSDLHPAILRTSKQIHSEASPLLYSRNTLQFPSTIMAVAHITPFLTQIRDQARLIRQIIVDYPTLNRQPGETTIDATDVINFDHIRNSCVNLKVLEFELCLETRAWYESDLEASFAAFYSFGEYLKRFSSMPKITVNVHVLEDDQCDSRLLGKMLELGWITRPKLVVKPKQLWYSDNGQFEFDNEEDYMAYCRDEWRREEEENERQSVEDYYEKRRDPYRKNSSDYD